MLLYCKSFTNFVEMTAIQNTPVRLDLNRDDKAVRKKKKKKSLGCKCLG